MEKEGVYTNWQIISREHPAITEYAAFVRSNANGHFLQDPGWARVKARWQWHGILVRRENGTVAAAVSVLSRRLPLGFSLAYAPRGPVCNRSDEGALGVLAAGLRAFAGQNRCLLTYLDPDEPEENAAFCGTLRSLGFVHRQNDGFDGIQPHSVFRIPLKDMGEEALLASFAPKTRYNIRLARRRGVTVSGFPGDRPIPREALDSFDALMQTTGKRDRFLVRDRAYFETLLTAMGGDAVLFLARLEGVPIAGAIALYYGNKAWYLYGASGDEHRGVMPNYLLQWTMLREALSRQCSLYDLRGVPGTGAPEDPLYGLYRFKKGFGGVHTRFAGLFTLYHRPVLGRLFDFGQGAFRRLRRAKNRRKAHGTA